MTERIKEWITVNGNHIPIFEGQSKEDAVKNFVSKQSEEDSKQKQIEANKKQAEERKATETQHAVIMRTNTSIPKRKFAMIRYFNDMSIKEFYQMNSKYSAQKLGDGFWMMYQDGNPMRMINQKDLLDILTATKTKDKYL